MWVVNGDGWEGGRGGRGGGGREGGVSSDSLIASAISLSLKPVLKMKKTSTTKVVQDLAVQHVFTFLFQKRLLLVQGTAHHARVVQKLHSNVDLQWESG